MELKHQDIISKMTKLEKAAFLSGRNTWQTRSIERLGIPSISCSDGPHGVRRQADKGDHLGLNESLPATCFPTASGIANSWDETLGQEIGAALGEEAKVLDVDILLGPGLNIKRSPLCGRNFEYFSEDPYLSGKMAAAYVRGIQEQGVYSCVKHFAVNSQELRRMAMNSVIDERTLRELYLTGFEIAVKEGGAKAVMTSYNEVNGTYANENQHLLIDILRQEWGFDGLVITDWGASNSHTAGVLARSDLEMPAPGLDSARELLESLENGCLSEEALDLCVDDLLDAVLHLKNDAKKTANTFDIDAHHRLAKKAASESAVLLKNENRILPLKKETKAAIIGDFAFEPRYQGAGSSLVKPTILKTVENCIFDTDLQIVGRAKGYHRNGKKDPQLIKGALELAKLADVVILFFGLDEMGESEGLDRTHLRIPENQAELINALSDTAPHLIGVISAGSVIEMPWQDKFEAILHGFLNGQAGAEAVCDILTGKTNPSGKLAETYPFALEETPSFRYFPSRERNSEYREGIFIGYRYFGTTGIPVRYPFGYGLSYTDFTYSDLSILDNGVSFRLTNSGSQDGAEISQLYIGSSSSVLYRAARELKGFARTFLKAGESREVFIPFDDKTFRYWNTVTNAWETEGGSYQIMIGASSQDIRLDENIQMKASTEQLPPQSKLPSYKSGTVTNVSDQEYEALLGYPIPDGHWNSHLTDNDAICQLGSAKSSIARLAYRILTHIKKKSEAKGTPNLNILFIYNMPFRAMAKMAGGAVDRRMVDGMVTVVNGHFFRGMKEIIGGFFANAKKNKQDEKLLAETIGGK